MFTGLIETTGEVKELNLSNLGARLSFSCAFPDMDTVKIGDSVSVNGVCLTVIAINKNVLTVDIMKETLKLTNLQNLKTGNIVNVERAMKVNSRLDGHLVSGHTDTTAKVENITNDGFAKRVKFACNNDLIIMKGSICVNGVSLTVSNITSSGFEVSLIPTTIENTNLKNLKSGDIVNIEYDLIGKYVKKFLKGDKTSSITEDFLKENGFY